jgi:hypothetical protein
VQRSLSATHVSHEYVRSLGTFDPHICRLIERRPSREKKERSADRPGSGGGNKLRPFDGGAERAVNETMVRPADRNTPGQTAPTAA